MPKSRKKARITREQLAEALEEEGMEAMIFDYCDPHDVQDMKLRILFIQFRALVEEIRKELKK